jgi:ATP-binding cassette, subfamily B, bacterial
MTQQSQPFSELRRLWGRIEPFRGRIILGTVYSLLNKLFDLAPPLLIGLAVDVVVRNKRSLLAEYGFPAAEQQLWVLAGLTFFIWGMESLFEYLLSITWRNLAQGLQHDIRVRAYSHVQDLDLAATDQLTSGKAMSVLNDDVNQLERFLDDGANTIIQLTATVVVVGALFVAAVPDLAWMAFIPAPLILIASVKVQTALGPRYRAVRDQVGRVNDLLANNLAGLVTIKSFVTEEHETRRLAKESLEYQHVNSKAISLSSAFVPLIRMAIVMGFILIMVYGGLQTIAGHLAVGTYSVLIFMTQRLLWPLTRLGTTLDLYRRSMASIQRILELLDTEPTLQDGPGELTDLEARGEISFQKVSFAYPSSGEAVLQDFSLTVKAGATLGIVGTTGSGKSTLVKMLLRFYDPQSGSIVIADRDLTSVSRSSLRSHIGLVSQDTFLFDGTVRENIIYGSFDSTPDQLERVVKQAAVDEFLDRLPNGIDTLVGERGVRLSGGQRQRIALARALLKNPPILVLDEATSAVDNETERAISEALEVVRKERTVLIVAHRLSTIRHADRIIVMENGKVTEDGIHEELVAQRGSYAGLWSIQSGEIVRPDLSGGQS